MSVVFWIDLKKTKAPINSQVINNNYINIFVLLNYKIIFYFQRKTITNIDYLRFLAFLKICRQIRIFDIVFCKEDEIILHRIFFSSINTLYWQYIIIDIYIIHYIWCWYSVNACLQSNTLMNRQKMNLNLLVVFLV